MSTLDMKLSDHAKIKADKVIVITGSARSGTTIVAKIVSSLKNIELDFEPPILLSLFSCLKKIKINTWRFLFTTYIYENFLLNSVAGRNLNLSHLDDSHTFKVKTKQEIQKRLNFPREKDEIEIKAKNYKCAFKLPDIVPNIKFFQKIFPRSKIIICDRTKEDVVNSLLRKKWFRKSCLKNKKIWPFRFRNKICIPFWIPKNMESLWVNANELTRCNLYYSLMTPKLPKEKNVLILRYEKLLQEPNKTAKIISKFCGSPVTKMTRRILKTVKKRYYLK